MHLNHFNVSVRFCPCDVADRVAQVSRTRDGNYSRCQGVIPQDFTEVSKWLLSVLGFQGVLRVMLFVLRQQAIIVDLCRREWPLTIAFCCGSITILSRQSSGPELRCCDMLRNSSKISPFAKTTKWFERDPISAWQQPGGIWAICFTLWPQLRHCALCRFVQHELCESAWVMLILSLAEDRCDFNHLRDSHPQPGRFSDDTASTKSHEKCLGFHSAHWTLSNVTPEVCSISVQYRIVLIAEQQWVLFPRSMRWPVLQQMQFALSARLRLRDPQSLPMSWRVAAHWNRFYCSSVPIIPFHSFQSFGISTFCPLIILCPFLFFNVNSFALSKTSSTRPSPAPGVRLGWHPYLFSVIFAKTISIYPMFDPCLEPFWCVSMYILRSTVNQHATVPNLALHHANAFRVSHTFCILCFLNLSFRLACFEQIDEIAQFGTQVWDFEDYFINIRLASISVQTVVSFQVAEEDSQVSAEAASEQKPFNGGKWNAFNQTCWNSVWDCVGVGVNCVNRAVNGSETRLWNLFLPGF